MKLVVKDTHPAVDGEYEFPREETLTNRELRFIKRESGNRAGEIRDALVAGDNDLIVCFALIALQRTGKIFDEDVLWDSPFGQISVLTEDGEEVEKDPPELRPDSERSENGPSESSSPSSNVGGA